MPGAPDRAGRAAPPAVVPVETETELLFQRVCEQVRGGLTEARPDAAAGETAGTLAGLATAEVLRALRVMSARQLAVLLAEEANRHSGHVIHEPPRYPASEVAGAEGSGPLAFDSAGPPEPAAAGTEEGPWAESPGAALIAVERSRQVTAEGYTPGHDAKHAGGEMARAAACYATPPDRRVTGTRLVDGSGDRGDRYSRYPRGWPWHPDFWKPGDRIRELTKAGALIAAELDRLIGQERQEANERG